MATKTTAATPNTTTTERAAHRPPPAAILVRAAGAALALVPAVLLCSLAVPHLRDGAAQDAAVPVPVYMIAQVAMPKVAYEDAAAALSRGSPRNGEAAIEQAEAVMRAGGPRAHAQAILVRGLSHDPASARGWTLLSEIALPTDRKAAARALSQALVLAPHDYWLVGARAQDAALLWSELEADSRSMALEQTRILWEEPPLRSQLLQLLRTPEGVALASRAFAGNEDEIRAMNRWLSRERREKPPEP